ncbi:MAG: hypothetical protein ACI8QS_001038 [Planctomycetota bacterium]|jgi:hypothetical protein
MPKLTSLLRRRPPVVKATGPTRNPRGARRGIFLAPLLRPRSGLRKGLLLGLLCLTPACISETPPGTYLDSEPPGALLFVDGKESGYVTPCKLHLDEGEDHVIRLEYPGYYPASIELLQDKTIKVISWKLGTNKSTGFASGFILPFWNLVAPIRTNDALSPGRIFARLVPLEEGEQ